MQYVDEHGKRVRKTTGTSDKTTANQMLAAAEKRVAQVIAGVIDSEAETRSEFTKQSIGEWLADYVAALSLAHKRESKHVADTQTKIEKILAASEVVSPNELTMDKVVVYTRDRQKKEDLSARTIQSYIVAIKAFTNWCTETNRYTRDPLATLSSPSPMLDRRYVRRALTHEEWKWLQRAALEGPRVRSLDGQQRALLYELAIVTGLRAKEIRSLTRSSFVFQRQPYVLLPASDTKNKKAAEQLLSQSLANKLQAYLGRKLGAAVAFDCHDVNRLSYVLRRDLEAARHAWLADARDVDERARREATDTLAVVDHQDRRIDFHALRYTCGAWLSLAGVPPKAIQSVMRHSTIRLTLDTYGHLFPQQSTSAIEELAKAIGDV
jgi:integrase